MDTAIECFSLVMTTVSTEQMWLFIFGKCAKLQDSCFVYSYNPGLLYFPSCLLSLFEFPHILFTYSLAFKKKTFLQQSMYNLLEG